MQRLVDADERYLARRRRFVSSWNRLAAILLLALGALLAWLTLQAPWLVNPLDVVRSLERGAVDPGTLELAAILLPLAVLLLFLAVSALVFLGFAVIRNERRYLAIIGQLREGR
ncbi:MAG: hypothetical protein D6786_08610 [Gammaproteobacteria bacterium]|nr:MAG: hypothetical protein D6786_08610 [Gammaproteobacteria bacterium]